MLIAGAEVLLTPRAILGYEENYTLLCGPGVTEAARFVCCACRCSHPFCARSSTLIAVLHRDLTSAMDVPRGQKCFIGVLPRSGFPQKIEKLLCRVFFLVSESF